MDIMWHKEKLWRVSPANFADDVLKQYNFPKQIEILDTTLRDGEQQPGLFIPPGDRLKLAKQMDAIGIHRIETGNPTISPQDADSVKAIVDLGLKAKTFVFCRSMAKDAQLAKDCGVNGVLMEIPASEHSLKYAKRWSVEQAIKAESTALKQPTSSVCLSHFFLPILLEQILNISWT